jgi:hypothetical protein
MDPGPLEEQSSGAAALPAICEVVRTYPYVWFDCRCLTILMGFKL